jgi:soluble lytic murein transglycosylase-like protein
VLSYVREVLLLIPCILLVAVLYVAFRFPIKQDRYEHAFLGHVPDRIRAYLRLFRSPRRASNARMPLEEIDRLIEVAAAAHGVDRALVRAVVLYESGGLPNTITTTGAMGLMALMPRTVRRLRVRDPFDPRDNVDGGSRLLAELLAEFGGDVDRALAGYNAGEDAVRWADGIPPYRETRDYVRHVRRLAEMCRSEESGGLSAGSPASG